ncbi:DUF4097 family beta strand repeat-containing protein [Paenibacillus arenilitoris]|uniref:DUF4097 family beta strand repeat protein n=1 Tax=Paenibacillus arenilitoris TaxID=2772299 RepID=A0A927CPN7_9BACL|nr:DUF4097 family beta strand repeat-containing protein [Paenibacillus arenilitoris]MBD2871918.1 DUF4097 family beta strand repeat protein [Paenibacillus arenilitoris]
MRNYIQMGKFMLLAMVAIGLASCSSPVTSLTGAVENAVIGEASGSGEPESRGKETFEADAFDSIRVAAEAMEIFVTRGTGDSAEAELLVDDTIKSRFSFEAKIKSRALVIDVEEKEPSGLFNKGVQEGERKLLISLPDKTYDEVKIESSFGIVAASDLNSDKLDIQVDAGTIRLNQVTGEMTLKTNAGDIEVEGLKLERDLSASADVGEIRIRLDEAPEAAEIDLRTDVGEATAELSDIDYSKNAANEKVGTIGSKGARIEAHTSVGAVRVDTE